jgi:hypothetical protein
MKAFRFRRLLTSVISGDSARNEIPAMQNVLGSTPSSADGAEFTSDHSTQPSESRNHQQGNARIPLVRSI